MKLAFSNIQPFFQAFFVLVASVALALVISWFHPKRDALIQLSSIRNLEDQDLGKISGKVLWVPSEHLGKENDDWDTVIEELAAEFHGREWVIVKCKSPGCDEGWVLAKRLRRYGFPFVALLRGEARK